MRLGKILGFLTGAKSQIIQNAVDMPTLLHWQFVWRFLNYLELGFYPVDQFGAGCVGGFEVKQAAGE